MAHDGDRLERSLYGAAFAALVAGAWAALLGLGASPWAGYLAHGGDAGGLHPALRVAVFVGGWTLMSVAMMLPSSLPLVTLFHVITRPRSGLLAVLVAGYLAVWALFGVAAFAADTGLHAALDASPALAARAGLVPAGLLLAAGLFQFSPLKHSCLEQCRSPLGFVVAGWSGGSGTRRAFALGLRHGLFCLGCCWALMLLMFAAGGVHLAWMLALGALMFTEKAVAWGRWITAPAGVALTAWGLALLLRVPGVPPPF